MFYSVKWYTIDLKFDVFNGTTRQILYQHVIRDSLAEMLFEPRFAVTLVFELGGASIELISFIEKIHAVNYKPYKKLHILCLRMRLFYVKAGRYCTYYSKLDPRLVL